MEEKWWVCPAGIGNLVPELGEDAGEEIWLPLE